MEALVDEVALAAASHDTEIKQDSGIFFWLCRSLQQHVDQGQRKASGEVLAPLGLLYLELLDQRGLLIGEQWGDENATLAWFEVAWYNVRFAKGESLLVSAMIKARKDGPNVAPGNLGLFVRLAWHLQKQSGEKPIFLPVCPMLAELFDVSMQTISGYVTICENRGYLIPKGKAVPHKVARTWMFNFKHPSFQPYCSES